MNSSKGTEDKESTIVHAKSSTTSSIVKFTFDHWTFNANTGELFDGKITTHLEPQVGKLLAYFLAHQQQIISRDELILQVWNGRFVSDDAINRCVSLLRQTLSPKDKHCYIETLVRKGYRAHFPPSQTDKPFVTVGNRQQRYFLLGLAIAVLVVIFYLSFKRWTDPPAPVYNAANHKPPMIAVLPFKPANDSEEVNFFANGVHDDLLTQLSKLQSLRVVSSTSVREYRHVSRNIRQIGHELGADVILEGGVQIANGQIRINAQLIDAHTDEHLWAETYDRNLNLNNIFKVQSEIALAITAAMKITLNPKDIASIALIPTQNMAAYRAYHRAMQMRHFSLTSVSGLEIREALEEAVELDPTFSRAWAELVANLAFQSFRRDDPELIQIVEEALHRLQMVAPGSADHLFGQAAYLYYVLQDYDKAHDVISQAVILNPSNFYAIQLRSWIERRQGDFEAFLQSSRDTRKLAPRNASWKDLLLGRLMLLHRFDEAQQELVKPPLNTYLSSFVASLFDFRENRNFKHLQVSANDRCRLYTRPDCGWIEHIANRDYQSALNALQKSQNQQANGIYLRFIFSYWLLKQDHLLKISIEDWLNYLSEMQVDSEIYENTEFYLAIAIKAASQGDVESSLQSLQKFLSLEPLDWAERVNFRHHACRILGLIDASEAAVQCIRDGLKEASYIIPFLEPYLPFYDSIREAPEFRALLAEIDG